MINSTETEGQFEFRPLEPGFGITIGNALRRILLYSILTKRVAGAVAKEDDYIGRGRRWTGTREKIGRAHV